MLELEASNLEENQETPKQNKYRKATRSLSPTTGSVSEPELPFKSPHTLLNASQSRRKTKKTYAEAVSGSGSDSEDEAEVKMRKKAVQQQGNQERRGGVASVEIVPSVPVRSSARSDDLRAYCSTLGKLTGRPWPLWKSSVPKLVYTSLSYLDD